MWARWSILLLQAAGCAERVGLLDVPIDGGTDEQRDLVREELAWFDGAVGQGRLQISSVLITPLEEPVGGKYRHSSGRVFLAADLPLDDLRETLRHELCHALDDTEDLMAAPNLPFDDLGDHVTTPGRDTARNRRGEALAEVCELGALRAYALAEPCPLDPPLAEELYGWAARHVWRGWEPDLDVAPLAAHARLGSLVGVTEVDVTYTDAPEVIYVLIGRGEVTSGLYVDLDSGAPAPTADPEWPRQSGLAWGDEGGPRVELLWSGPPEYVGSPEYRYAASLDGERWGRVPDLCVGSDVTGPFFARGLPWFAWMDGTDLAWGPVRER